MKDREKLIHTMADFFRAFVLAAYLRASNYDIKDIEKLQHLRKRFADIKGNFKEGNDNEQEI